MKQQKFIQQSLDDKLEDERPESIEYGLNQPAQPEDNDSPAEAAKNPFIAPLPKSHPRFDTENDTNEVYEEGESGVAYPPQLIAKQK